MQINWLDFSNNTTACYIFIIIVLTVIYYYFTNRDIPPGPIGIPYFGYWPFLEDANVHLQLQELGRKYGEVFSFTVTGQLFVNLGSFKSNKEAFVSKLDCFRERMKGFGQYKCIMRGSLLSIGGKKWKTNKKFFLQLFQERGMIKMKEQTCGPIYDVIQDTIEDLRTTHGCVTDIKTLLTVKCSKILFQVFFGGSGITEEEILKIADAYTNIIENKNNHSALLCGTFAKYFISPFIKSFEKVVKKAKIIEDMMHEIVERNKKKFNDRNTLNCIDAYYKEKQEKLSKKDPTAEFFTDFILVGTLIEFIEDGVVSVVRVIGQILSSLAKYPEEQERIYQELVDVVGTQRDPVMEDKSKLSYTNAFILEVMRTATPFPMFPKLQCTKEVYIGGYRIPKGSNMLLNMWNTNYDPDVYEDPEKFNPSRFLAQNGEKRPEQPISFGIGKHKCAGETFVMTQVFLFTITLLKYFQFRVPEDADKKLLICAFPRKD